LQTSRAPIAEAMGHPILNLPRVALPDISIGNPSLAELFADGQAPF